MTTVHWLMIAVFVLGAVAGCAATYWLLFQSGVDAAVTAHQQGFEKGALHTAEALSKLHQEGRHNHARQLASNLSPILAEYGKHLILMHYGCDDGCERDHQEEVLEIERTGKPKSWDARIEAAQKALCVTPDGHMDPVTAKAIFGAIVNPTAQLALVEALPDDRDRAWVVRCAHQEIKRNEAP